MVSFFHKSLYGASDKGLFILGSSAFIDEYVRTRQIPITRLLQAFGIDLVFHYKLSRATLFFDGILTSPPPPQCPELQDRRPKTMTYFLRVAMSHQ